MTFEILVEEQKYTPYKVGNFGGKHILSQEVEEQGVKAEGECNVKKERSDGKHPR